MKDQNTKLFFIFGLAVRAGNSPFEGYNDTGFRLVRSTIKDEKVNRKNEFAYIEIDKNLLFDISKENITEFNTPILATIKTMKPIYENKFDKENENWKFNVGYEGIGNGKIENGAYSFRARYNSGNLWVYPDIKLNDFVIKCDVKFIKGFSLQNYLYLYFNSSGNHSNHYQIQIRGNGEIRLGRAVSDKLIGIKNSSKSELIKPDMNFIELTIIRKGPVVSLLINDIHQFIYKDEKYLKNYKDVDFRFRFCNDMANEDIEVYIDNFKIWNITNFN